jgi:hypothetical protein
MEILIEKERELTAQEREEYFMKLLEGRKKKGNAETEIKKKQKAPEETEITYVCMYVCMYVCI